MCVMRPDRVITARMQHILIDYYNTKGTKGGGRTSEIYGGREEIGNKVKI